MKNKNILKKTAKKSISWLLILGMLITLPQTPGAVSAAAAGLKTETETVHAEEVETETRVMNANEAETETEEVETETETVHAEEAETENATVHAENAVTKTDLTVHFKNENNWDKVYVKFGAGDSWAAVKNFEYCKNYDYGGLLKENSKNKGWYSFKVEKDDALDLNGLFNAGAWGDDNQTENFKIEITSETMEVWITGKTVSEEKPESWAIGETVSAPVDVTPVSGVESPVLGKDSSVTFNYEISADKLGTEKLYLMGSLTDWTDGYEMTDEDKDGIYSITVSDKPAGIYEYKFKYGSNWVTDPANKNYSNGNSKVVIPGLGSDTLEAKVGVTTALPDTLKYYTADGTVADVKPEYTLETSMDGVSIDEGKLTLSDDVTATDILVIASYKVGDDVYKSTVYVNVVMAQYNYHIYYYADNEDRVTADSAALWLYGDGVNGTLHDFTDTTEIDGYTWLTYTWTTSLGKR